jgi:hypothetical protein
VDPGYVDVVLDGANKLLVEASGTTITDDLTINGDLFVDGTTWVVHNQEVTTSDNIIVINNGETGPGVTAGSAGIEVDRGSETNYQFLFVEASDTFRIGEIGSLQAVATREDSPTDLRVPWWNDTNKKFETLGGTFITINDSGDTIAASINDVQKLSITASSMQLGDTASGEYILVNGGAGNLQFYTVGKQLELDSNGMTLASGASVNEFSTDGTLAGDSDDAVPTEKAVKTYVDTEIANIAADQIIAGDSYVKVVDDGTAAGYIEVVADGVQVQYWDAQAATLRMGKASAAGRVEVSDTEVSMSIGATKVIAATETDVEIAGDLYVDGDLYPVDTTGLTVVGTMSVNTPIEPEHATTKAYVDAIVGTEIVSGIADLVNGDSTASIAFEAAQADTNYVITTHLVNTTDANPSIYVHMTTDYDVNGFTEIFSGPMDSANYKLHYQITRDDSEESVPCGIQYVNYNTDAYWQDDLGDAEFTYPENQWLCTWGNDGENTDANAALAPSGGWQVDFRTENKQESGEIKITCAAGTADPGTMDNDGEDGHPLTVKITINGTEHTGTFQGLGGGSSSRVWNFDDIDEGDGDISSIEFSAVNGNNVDEGSFFVTGIEFYVDTCDLTPGGVWGDGGGEG